MADTGSTSENVGAINVTIAGDYSQLKDDFAASQTDAKTAGSAIADAFNGVAATGVDALTDAMTVLAATMSTLGAQVDGLAETVDDYAASEVKAGEDAEEAATGIKAMAEQMSAVGESLVITEGLRELGMEALTAADSITHASIALTTITGSGDTAKETIEGLEQLGQSDGLAMPSLLSAATRMTAILGPATDVTGELKLIADGAAVMGTDIETATAKFDQLATAGTASARTLTALGISLGSLATAYNSVIAGSDKTASSVAASFKALDQSQRIDVLNAALATLGGTAQQVAQQTFGGQWQTLADQWEHIMVQAGQALLPVISDLTDFVKIDVIPFVQGLVDAWNELPKPMQDASVALTLVGAALVPITGALAAGSLAVGALSGVLPALNGLLSTLGITAATTAVEEGTAATATVALGTASETASAEIAAAGGAAGMTGGVIGGVLAAALVAGAALWSDYKTRIDAARASVNGLADNDLNSYLSTIAHVSQGTGDAGTATQQWEAKLATLKTGLDLGAISATQYAAAVKLIETAQENLEKSNLAASIAGWVSGLTIVKDTTQKTTTEIGLLTAALADSKSAFDTVAVKYQAGAATAAQYLTAQNAVTAAQKNLDEALGPIPGSMDAIDAAAAKLAASTNNLVSAQQVQANEQSILGSSLDLANTAYATSVNKVGLLVAALDQAKAAYDGSAASRQKILDLETGLQKAYGESVKAQDGLTSTLTNYAEVMGGAVAEGQTEALKGLQALASVIPPAMQDFIGLTSAVQALQSEMPNFGIAITQISTGPLVGLQSALDEAKAKTANLWDEMSQGANVGQQYEKALTAQMNAQIALDQETAILGTGLANQTDILALLTTQVAAAQAKVLDLTTAVQNGLPVQAQLLAAQKSLITTQTELNAAIAAQQQPLSASTSGLQANTGAANTDANALQSVAAGYSAMGAAATAAAAQASTASTSISQAISQLQQAFGGGSSTSSASSTAGFGGPPGTFPVTIGVIGSGNYQIGFDLTPEQAVKDMYASANYTPSQISHITGIPLQTVLQYLGLQISSANSSSVGVPGDVVVDPKQSTGLPTVGTPVAAAPGSSTATATSSGALDSSSYGGSYPGVVAHQAAGEVWVVDTNGVASGGSVAAVSPAAAGVSGDASTAALAASSTASTVATAASTMSEVVAALQIISDSVVYLAATGANGKSVASGLNTVLPAGSVSSGVAATAATGSTGTVASTPTVDAQRNAQLAGVIWDGSVPWDGLGYSYSGQPTSKQATLNESEGLAANGQPIASVPHGGASVPTGGGGRWCG